MAIHNSPDNAARLDSSRLAINAAWLAQLRWVAVAGQLATIAVVVFGLQIDAPTTPLLVLVLVTAATNAAFDVWVRWRRARPGGELPPKVWHMALGGPMLLDLLVLTAMLSLTGGPTNPFAVFYFVNLALSGVLLPARWAWLLCGMAVVAFGLISYQHLPMELLREPQRMESFAQLRKPHVVGLGALVAFGACSSVIVSFTTRLTRELRRAQQARFEAEELRARSEKLEALGTLAAGAAHELATPLSAIAVAAGELHNELEGGVGSQEAADDVRLIREALARCRKILDRMSMESGQAAGEALATLDARGLIDQVLEDLAGADRVRLEFAGGGANAQLTVPRTALSQAIRALVQNALDAVGREGIDLSVEKVEDRLLLVIVDRGEGMPASVLARAGEPFFTTKEPGRGMGLGLFLARSVIERIGGRLDIESEPGTGTTVSVTLPISGADGGAEAVGDSTRGDSLS